MNFLKKELATLNIFSKDNPLMKGKTTFGQKAADKLTTLAGSWAFIIIFIVFLILWMIFNTTFLIFGSAWDSKPFIMLNLILSCLAALQAPIILMSKNRQAQRDSLKAEYDYRINKKAEKEIQEIRDFLLGKNKKTKKKK